MAGGGTAEAGAGAERPRSTAGTHREGQEQGSQIGISTAGSSMPQTCSAAPVAAASASGLAEHMEGPMMDPESRSRPPNGGAEQATLTGASSEVVSNLVSGGGGGGGQSAVRLDAGTGAGCGSPSEEGGQARGQGRGRDAASQQVQAEGKRVKFNVAYTPAHHESSSPAPASALGPAHGKGQTKAKLPQTVKW